MKMMNSSIFSTINAALVSMFGGTSNSLTSASRALDRSIKNQARINSLLDEAMHSIYDDNPDTTNNPDIFGSKYANAIFSQKFVINAVFDGNIEFMNYNMAWEYYLGYNSKELIGKKYSEIVHKADMDRTLPAANDNFVEGATRPEYVLFKNRYMCKCKKDHNGYPVYRWLMWYPAINSINPTHDSTLVASAQVMNMSGGISMLSYKNMMDNRHVILRLLDEISHKWGDLKSRQNGDNITFYIDGHEEVLDMRSIFSSVIDETYNTMIESHSVLDLLQDNVLAAPSLQNYIDRKSSGLPVHKVFI